MIEVEHLEICLRRSIDDGAVVQFADLSCLLKQLDEHLRREVSRAFKVHEPFVDGLGFFWAHLRTDDVADGMWGVAKTSGAFAGYGLLVACGPERYAAAIQHLKEVGRQHGQIWFN